MSQITNIDSRPFGRLRASPVVYGRAGMTLHVVKRRGKVVGMRETQNLRGIDRVIAKDAARQVIRDKNRAKLAA